MGSHQATLHPHSSSVSLCRVLLSCVQLGSFSVLARSSKWCNGDWHWILSWANSVWNWNCKCFDSKLHISLFIFCVSQMVFFLGNCNNTKTVENIILLKASNATTTLSSQFYAFLLVDNKLSSHLGIKPVILSWIFHKSASLTFRPMLKAG